MDWFRLVYLVIAFPLLAFLINIFFGRKLGEKSGILSSLAAGLAFVVSVILAIQLMGSPEPHVVPLLNWIDIGQLKIPWDFRVDTLSVTMMLVVSGVGTLIHIYAIGYMHDDVRHNGDPKRYPRFFVYFSLFITEMMMLVTANNYIVLFVGWEGVGLCSYLLIGFWYEKGKDGIGNAIAAKKAMVVNRIGDVGFLIAMFLIFGAFKTFEFDQIFKLVPQVAASNPAVLLAITLFLLLGVTGKSAQLPLYVWLPDAMAGPTPVSALIHAATMVTAGVYLVARSHFFYSAVPAAQNMVALVGGITALFAATIAVAQFDIKKVLAYSTVSQLGFMVAAVGMGAFTAGMFHLVTHAFFKALLFLSAGSVIQGMERGEHVVEHDPHLKKQMKGHEHLDVQDMRNMGGLRNRMKVTYAVYLVGALALSGIPIWAGFWSKDEILAEGYQLNLPVYILLSIAALLTAIYSWRQVWMVFGGKPRTVVAENAVESPPVMTVPLVILGVLATIGGALNLPGLQTLTNWLNQTLEATRATVAAEAASGFNLMTMIIATLLALIGFAIAWVLYRNIYPRLQSLPLMQRPDDPLQRYLGPVFTGMENKWGVDELYDFLIVRPYKWLGRTMSHAETQAAQPDLVKDWIHEVLILGSYKFLADFFAMTLDLGFIDAIINLAASGIRALSGRARGVQTGFVRNYALAVFLGVVVIVGYLTLR